MQHDAIPADCGSAGGLENWGEGRGGGSILANAFARSPVRDRFLNFSRIVENRWLSNNRDKTFLKFEQILQNRIET